MEYDKGNFLAGYSGLIGTLPNGIRVINEPLPNLDHGVVLSLASLRSKTNERGPSMAGSSVRASISDIS